MMLTLTSGYLTPRCCCHRHLKGCCITTDKSANMPEPWFPHLNSKREELNHQQDDTKFSKKPSSKYFPGNPGLT